MKILTYSFLLLTLFLFTSKNVYADDKVTLCHVTVTPNQTLEVKKKDVDKHLDHGDYLGTCYTPTPTPTITLTPTPTSIPSNPPSVPEFGLITGVVTLLGSAGSLALLRRKV